MCKVVSIIIELLDYIIYLWGYSLVISIWFWKFFVWEWNWIIEWVEGIVGIVMGKLFLGIYYCMV